MPGSFDALGDGVVVEGLVTSGTTRLVMVEMRREQTKQMYRELFGSQCAGTWLPSSTVVYIFTWVLRPYFVVQRGSEAQGRMGVWRWLGVCERLGSGCSQSSLFSDQNVADQSR